MLPFIPIQKPQQYSQSYLPMFLINFKEKTQARNIWSEF